MTEPWLCGTLTEVPAVLRAVLHALELAQEDLTKWCGGLSEEQLGARPLGMAPVAFHLRHIARSLDRLLTYAEQRELNAEQVSALQSELDCAVSREAMFSELERALDSSAERIRAFVGMDLEQPRRVGKKALPSSLGGLLVHMAEHTGRHVGQAITTAKLVAKFPGEDSD